MTLILGIILPTVAQKIPAYVPTNGLVGWWPFNGNANDESGNGNHGKTFKFSDSTDRFGNKKSAIYLNGLDNFIEIPHHSDMNSLPFSISFWMNSNEQNKNGKLFNKVCCSSWNGWDIELVSTNQPNKGIWHFEYYNSTCKGIYQTYCSPVQYPSFETHDDKWHHIVFTVDSSIAKVYIDSKLSHSQNWDGLPTAPNSTLPINIGRYGQGNFLFYKGFIDDVGLWKKALSNEDVLKLYNSIDKTTAEISNKILDNFKICIYPNPTKNIITISNLKSNSLISITDLNGRKIYESEVINETLNLTLNEIADKGIYFVNLYENGIKINSSKIILE